jgi:hypothetical protein
MQWRRRPPPFSRTVKWCVELLAQRVEFAEPFADVFHQAAP